MSIGDHPAWEPYLVALERLTNAARRLDHARQEDAADLRSAESDYEEALEQYDAARAIMI